MNECIFCGSSFSGRKNGYRFKSNCCDACRPHRDIGIPRKPIETINLAGYGRVSVNRIKELERRVILPYNAPDGGYYVGRKGENGRIQEREPSY